MTRQHLTVREAARRLGISEDAVRMRVKRGTLEANKEGNRLYVLLEEEPDEEPTTEPTAGVIDELLRQNEYLRQQLDIRTDELREQRRLMAAALERIPAQLEAPREATKQSSTEMREPSGEGDSSSYRTIREKTPTKSTSQIYFLVGFLITIVPSVLGLSGTIISAGGESFSSTFSSIGSAFTSIGSSLSGDQIVTIISALIGLVGAIGAAYLTVKLTRAARR